MQVCALLPLFRLFLMPRRRRRRCLLSVASALNTTFFKTSCILIFGPALRASVRFVARVTEFFRLCHVLIRMIEATQPSPNPNAPFDAPPCVLSLDARPLLSRYYMSSFAFFFHRLRWRRVSNVLFKWCDTGRVPQHAGAIVPPRRSVLAGIVTLIWTMRQTNDARHIT